MIDRYRTGFPIPGPIPFEDLSNGPHVNSNNVINTPDNRSLKTVSVKSGTVGKAKKNRGGLFKIFGGTNVSINCTSGHFLSYCLSLRFFFSMCVFKNLDGREIIILHTML